MNTWIGLTNHENWIKQHWARQSNLFMVGELELWIEGTRNHMGWTYPNELAKYDKLNFQQQWPWPRWKWSSAHAIWKNQSLPLEHTTKEPSHLCLLAQPLCSINLSHISCKTCERCKGSGFWRSASREACIWSLGNSV